jgi:flagella basal body P-ring formation protein FlgA
MKHLITLTVILLFALVPNFAQSAVSRDEEIRAAVETYVRQRTASLGCEIRVKSLSFSGAVALPAGGLEYEIVAPQQWEGWGHASIAVIVRQGDRVVRNIPARVDVEALAEMVVSVRQIDHGALITNNDITLKKLDVAATQGRYLGSINDVVGKRMRRTMRPNTPFMPDQLEKVALIKSGQVVTVVAENERMRVTLTGKAKSAGGEGDIINVQNVNSLKEFPARIIDANTVVVAF